MSSSKWLSSELSERLSGQYICHQSMTSKAGSDTSTNLVQDKACLHTPTTSEFGSHNGYNDAHNCPAPSPFSPSPTPLPIRVPKHEGPKGRRVQDVCNSAPDTEQRKPRRSARSSVYPSKRAHSPHDRGPTRFEEFLDTSETYSCGVSKLDPGHQFATVVDEITSIAVKRFCSLRIHAPVAKSIDSLPRRRRKRSRLAHRKKSATVAPSSGSEVSDDILTGQRPVKVEPKVWPCPFFVKDRKSHISCLTRHCLLSIADVREHLILKHRRPLYCSVCYEVFPTDKLRDAHMRSWECVHLPEPPTVLEGITDAQVQLLEEQENSGDLVSGSQLIQWYQVWQVVFPHAQPFPWPCSFSSREFKVYELRRFWKRNGEGIISDVLREHQLQGYNIANEERNLKALFSLVADRAVDDLLLIQTGQAQAV